MQASEALQRLIALSDWASQAPSFREPRTEEEQEVDATATAICQAMLNTAIPVARFRVFFQVDEVPGKHEGFEYTICAVSIGEIQVALRHHRSNTKVHVTLWEQKQAGAEMLSGYQGATSSQYRRWVNELTTFQEESSDS